MHLARPSEAAPAKQRAAWVEIDVDAIRHNLGVIRQLAGAARVYVVCKGDAYGFDAVMVAHLAAEAGMDALACGDPREVRRIRAAGIALPILLYGVTVASALPGVAESGVVVTAHDRDSLETCVSRRLGFALKIDAGFGRLGFRATDLAWLVPFVQAHPDAPAQSIYAHLADSDDPAAVQRQAELFGQLADEVEAAGWPGLERMVASSRVMIAHPGLALQAVNPGRLVYGLLESPWHTRVAVRPALAAVKGRIIALKDVAAGNRLGYGGAPLGRDSRVAVVPYGFGDGYPRYPAGGVCLVHGRRAPMVGPRQTEHTIVDITDVPAAALGDEVVFLGSQGGECIDIHELSAATGVPVIELGPRLARAATRQDPRN